MAAMGLTTTRVRRDEAREPPRWPAAGSESSQEDDGLARPLSHTHKRIRGEGGELGVRICAFPRLAAAAAAAAAAAECRRRFAGKACFTFRVAQRNRSPLPRAGTNALATRRARKTPQVCASATSETRPRSRAAISEKERKKEKKKKKKPRPHDCDSGLVGACDLVRSRAGPCQTSGRLALCPLGDLLGTSAGGRVRGGRAALRGRQDERTKQALWRSRERMEDRRSGAKRKGQKPGLGACMGSTREQQRAINSACERTAECPCFLLSPSPRTPRGAGNRLVGV